MQGGAAGTIVTGAGTNGGEGGASGRRWKAAAILATGFLAILAVVTIGNVESTISDLAAAGVRETRAHVWIWQISSVVAWLSVAPLIWWGVATVRPPRFGWPLVMLVAVIGLPVASAWHIAVMIGLRHLAYAAMDQHYTFAGSIADPYLYEFRKDAATYLQFAGLAVLAQWMLRRLDPTPHGDLPPPSSPERATFTVTDGAKRYMLPIDTIEHVSAAGNYVEVHAEGRVLMHRATLTGMESELGSGFIRIHRSRLVRRAAVRSVQNDRSGDFSVELESGTTLSGSRRYRGRLDPRPRDGV